MTVYEYRTKLLAALADYDAVEVVNAANYYAELIEDADDPEEQMNRLGPPEVLARMIIEENGWEDLKKQRYYEQAQSTAYYEQPYSGMGQPGQPGQPGKGGRVLALILTFPLWITVYALILSLLITVVALLIALPVSFVAIMIEGITAMFSFVPYGVELMFVALIILGLTVITAAAARPLLSGTGGLFGKFSRFLFGTNRDEGLVPHEHRGVNKPALVIGAVMLVAGIVGTAVTDNNNMNNMDSIAAASGIESFDVEIGTVPDYVLAYIGIGKMNIGISPDNSAHLSCTNAVRDKLTVTEGITLDISYSEEYDNGIDFDIGFSNRFRTERSPEFTLLLPSKQYNELNVAMSLGSLTVNNINSDAMIYINESGAITISDCKAKELTLNNDLGGIKTDNVQADTVKIDNGSGRIDLDKCIFSDVEIDSDLGAVDIDNSSLGKTIIRNASGSIMLEECTQTGAFDITSDLGGVKIDESVVDRLTANCSSGKFKMKGSAVKTSADIGIDLGGAELDLVNGSYDVKATVDLGEAKVNGEDAANAPSGNIPITIRSNSGDVDVTLR